MYAKHIDLGKFTQNELDQIIREASGLSDIAFRAAFLSRQFLGVGYREHTLIGDNETPEAFVINLGGVDCFTFIEYIEAMRLAASFQDFETKLREVRYKSGMVEFTKRNHFFTDWREYRREFVHDITEDIGGTHIVKSLKILNKKEDRRPLIPGIAPVQREVAYIPSEIIDDAIADKLMTGDYIGIYSDTEGLDVSHVGITATEGKSLFLRHASSHKEHRQVVEQELRHYIAGKPGIVILRPIDSLSPLNL